MHFELSEIRELRKRLGLTQSELAKKANVSQSLIAKIESGRIDPTFSKTRSIFDVVNRMSEEKGLIAEDIMNRKIISVHPYDTISSVIKKMKTFEISQLPVIEEGKSLGIVSESAILDAIIQGKKEFKAMDVMHDSPPIISGKASASVVSNLLRVYPLLLISERGKLVGLLTKSDLIRKMYK